MKNDDVNTEQDILDTIDTVGSIADNESSLDTEDVDESKEGQSKEESVDEDSKDKDDVEKEEEDSGDVDKAVQDDKEQLKDDKEGKEEEGATGSEKDEVPDSGETSEDEEEDSIDLVTREQHDVVVRQLIEVSKRLNEKQGLTLEKPQTKDDEASDTTQQDEKDILKSSFNITDEEYDNAMLNREGLEKLLGKIVGNLAVHQNDVEQRVNDNVTKRIQARDLEAEFYLLNPDLKSFDSYVDVVAVELKGDNKYKDHGEFFVAIAETVRTRLSLPAETKTVIKPGKTIQGKRKPAFARGSSSRKATKKIDAEQQDILDTVEDF